MNQDKSAPFLIAAFFSILFAACTGQPEKIIFRPDVSNNPKKQTGPFESWEITRSQNGPVSKGGSEGDRGYGNIPEWVSLYISNEINEIEALERFEGKYIFIGGNGGSNFNALQQWATGFTAENDLSGLITLRAESRLVADAALYPDDEYGEYFEFLIKAISNGEYPGAVKEQTFWLARTVSSGETSAAAVGERYEFLVLVSIDRETLQRQLQRIILNIKTKVPPTKEQAAAIARIKSSFFEGF